MISTLGATKGASGVNMATLFLLSDLIVFKASFFEVSVGVQDTTQSVKKKIKYFKIT
jgi:hypothetical protein